MAAPKKKTPTKRSVPAKKTVTAIKPADQEFERKRKTPKYKSFRLTKKIPHPAGPLPSSWVILKKTGALVRKNIKPLLGIVAVYILLNLVLVHGFSSPLDINDLKDSIKETLGGGVSNVSFVGVVFTSLLSTSTTNTGDTAAVYQIILFLVTSLALIWVFRQSFIGKKPTVKAAYYTGMYPLVPFLLVLVVLMLQFVPSVLAAFIYRTVTTGGLAISGYEHAIWILFLASIILLSLYMVCSSLFGLYVATLPNMSPMSALRSSRQLVFSRRMSVFRKLLVLPIIAVIILLLIVVPAIYFLPGIASWLYFGLSLATIVFLHAYLFTLYRELL